MNSHTPPGSNPGAIAPKASKKQVFFKRLISTLILWGVILGGLFGGGQRVSLVTFWLIICGLGFAAFREYVKMVDVKGMVFAKNSLFVAGLVYLSFELLAGASQGNLLKTEIPMLVLGLVSVGMVYLLFHYRYTSPRLAPLAKLLFGWFYIFFLAGFLVRIFTFDSLNGAWLLILFIVLTKFSDLGAYVTGSLIGRHKMIPKVSPAKTWEGFCGAIFFSAIFGLLLVKLFDQHYQSIPAFHVVILGAVLGASAVFGDLVESLLKREAQVKDSGQFIPGIGGALDLIDSLLFNAPLMYAYLQLF
jgi:phosphatidate cytidylyltransferase